MIRLCILPVSGITAFCSDVLAYFAMPVYILRLTMFVYVWRFTALIEWDN